MMGVLRNRTYRQLFFAQVIALLGTGLATVALGLLAFDLSWAALLQAGPIRPGPCSRNRSIRNLSDGKVGSRSV